MNDLNKALADIGKIRDHLAAGTMFRGLGPTVIAASGLLALFAMLSQIADVLPNNGSREFIVVWVAVAFVSATVIGLEMRARTRRAHVGIANAMLLNAIEHFVPVGAAGAVIAAIVMQRAPDCAWMLPGLWQILVGVGLFAAVRFLPRSVTLAAAWYFLAGTAVLVLSSETRVLSPIAMGLPFAVGQILLALLLHIAEGGADVEAD
jgi:hypothetical protein